MHHRRIVAFVNILLVFVLFGFGCVSSPVNIQAEIMLPDNTIVNLDIARSDSKRAQGLSGRESIGDGMVFCYDDEEIRSFWMHDMLVPLDVLWIRDNLIIGLESDIPIMTGDIFGEVDGRFIHADSTWTRFVSPEPVDAVIELQAGSIKNGGYEVGQIVLVDKYCY